MRCSADVRSQPGGWSSLPRPSGGGKPEGPARQTGSSVGLGKALIPAMAAAECGVRGGGADRGFSPAFPAADVPEGGGDPGRAEPAHRRQPPALDRGPLLRKLRPGPRGHPFPPRRAGPPLGPPQTWRAAGMAAPAPRRCLLSLLLLLALAALGLPPPIAAQPPHAALRAGHAASSLPAAAAAPRLR